MRPVWGLEKGEFMSKQHTQGRLHVGEMHAGGRIALMSERFTIADVLSAFSSGVDEANARRLVACWNACEGIPTDWMEKHAFGSIDATLQSAMSQVADARAQRDQLLAALRNYVDGCSMSVDASTVARSAIAACQPQPTVVHLPSDDTEGGAA
jgi:uncharacterized protein (DUF1810 family)